VLYTESKAFAPDIYWQLSAKIAGATRYFCRQPDVAGVIMALASVVWVFIMPYKKFTSQRRDRYSFIRWTLIIYPVICTAFYGK
jgi:hypothetical protein